MAKYSIILPVRNGGKYIKQCVDSVLGQTYPDFNFIVLDNCSTDGTLEWLRSVTDERIKIITSDKLLTIEESWGRIKDIEKNEFITLIGHDDILYPGYLEKLNSIIKAHPTASLYLTYFDFIDKNGKIIRRCQHMDEVIDAQSFLKSVLSYSLDITGTGFMLRSKDYDGAGGIPPYPNLLYADIELWFRIIEKGYMAISQGNYFAFRFHTENTSKSFGETRMKAFAMSIDFLNKIKNEKKEYKEIIDHFGYQFLLTHITGACHKLIYVPIRDRNKMDINKILKESKLYAQKLIPDIYFKPEKSFGVLIARFVDSNIIFRKLFLFYTKFKRRTF